MRDLERRVAALEASALWKARARRDAYDELKDLSRNELMELAAACLVAHGADPETAGEVWRESWRLGADRGETWAELVQAADKVLALFLKDIRHKAALGGAAPDVVARLDDPEFRQRVWACGARVWDCDVSLYCDGFAWTMARVAAGWPDEAFTYEAYYGPERAREMNQLRNG